MNEQDASVPTTPRRLKPSIERTTAMASLITERSGKRVRYRIQFRDGDGKRRSIRLSELNRKAAEAVASKIEALNACRISGQSMPTDLAQWVVNLGDELHGKLATAGLVEPRQSSTLGGFLVEYIDGRKADSSLSTINNFRHLQQKLIGFFGDCDMRSIDEGQCDDWRRSLARDYADATISKHVKRARQVFKAAIRKRVCDSNPFAEIKGGSEQNDSCKHFVEQAVIDAVLEHCPDTEWRLITALARFGGLRTPSETLGLRWNDIDWGGQRFTVTSPKTKRHNKPWRVVPLFPELLPYLSETFEQAPVGSEFVITRYRSANSNLRTQYLRIIRKAGVEPWPRLFQNLRASRETELANSFPLHVVTSWLGNTPSVADRHYLQVTSGHFAQAVAEGGAGGGATGGAAARCGLMQ